MQPNSFNPPTQNPDQNNEPPVDPAPAPTSWDTAPRTESSATPLPRPTSTPQQSRPDFSRYQPQPLQSAEPKVEAETLAPTTVEYTEKEPDTVVAPVAQQNNTPQQSTPVSVAETESIAEPQVATIPQPMQTQQSAPQIAKPKKSRLGLIITSIVIGVLLLGGGAAAYVMNQSAVNKKPEVATNAPAAAPAADEPILNIQTGTREEYLNQALENHMKTSYTAQTYVLHTSELASAMMIVKATSDFSSVKTPQSIIWYSLDQGQGATSSGELIFLKNKEIYANLMDSAAVKKMKPATAPKLGQWYKIDTLDLSDQLAYDPARLSTVINTPGGNILVGKFDSDTRKDLMAFIKENKIYTINSSEDVVVDEVPMTHYTMTLNMKKLEALNMKAFEAIGLDYDLGERFPETPGRTDEIWVDQKTGRIAKTLTSAEVSGANGKITKMSIETTTHYPATNSDSIAKPANAIAAPMQ